MATSLPLPSLMIPPRVELDDPATLVRGTSEWLRRANLVRGALEANGCLVVRCRSPMPPELRQRMLEATPELFSFRTETKHRIGGADVDGPYKAYLEKRDSATCRYEAFGLANADAGGGEEARKFVARAWPLGNDRFLETLTSAAGEMAKLARVILTMVVDSYGLAHRSDETVAATDTNFRMYRYDMDSSTRTSPDEQPALGLCAHVDASYLTILFQNDVDGFEMKTRDGGDWVRVSLAGSDSLLVIAGQPLVAWSNGKVHAPCTGWLSAGWRTGCPAACSCCRERTSSSTRRRSWSPRTRRAGSGPSGTWTTSSSSKPTATARTCWAASPGCKNCRF
uniref:Uncharacterized protein n=1 Tax=Avena sativa TaxID=4498 RepID=A0ACD5VU84_AVESA